MTPKTGIKGIEVETVEMKDGEGWTRVEASQIPTYSFKENGDTLIGTYIKFRSNVGPNASMLYQIKTETGEEFVVWGCDVLDRRMEAIKPGARVKIVYKGTKTSEKSGRPYHDYDLFTK